jgi:large subunit ribosomal protein L4
MSAIPAYTRTGTEAGHAEVAEELLCRPRNRQLIQDAVTAHRANQRAGTASTKTKGVVRGSGKKPWRQKGTGNARAGYRQSPVWRGGGTAFGPLPRGYRVDLPKKAARLAFAQAFTEQVDAGVMKVVEDLPIDTPKTKALAAVLRALGADGPTLLVVASVEPNLALASRNIPYLEVAEAKDINTYQLVRYPLIILSREALAVVEQRLRSRVGNGA